jgi:predicted site-specific integrase-resolvase
MGTGLGNEDLPTVGYARVAGPGQEADLTRQEESLGVFCTAKSWRHEVISDLGAGPGSNKGLRRLIELISHKRIRRLVVTHKDRLSRFGSEIIFALCAIQDIEIVITNKGQPPPLGEQASEDLAQQDAVEIRQLCEQLIKDIAPDATLMSAPADACGTPAPPTT